MNVAKPDPAEFRSDGKAPVSVWLSPAAISSMMQSAVRAGRCETGGILIGRYGPEGWVADVMEATPKPKGSRSGWFWFERSDIGLATLLEERWQHGLHYLGEWHSHPGGSPTPSDSDLRAMDKVARDDAYRCPAPLLVIVGGGAKSTWSLSATLVRDGRPVVLERQNKQD